jgi:DnaK suppressor protein
MTPHENDNKNHERYEVLRRMLEDRRSEIQEKLRSLLDTLPQDADVVRDIEEQSVTDFVQAVDFALMQLKSQTLAKIDEALRRLEQGTYGVCADCGRPIPEARLTALPFANRCRDCQEREEAVESYTSRGETGLGVRLREGMELGPSREAKHE